MPKIFMVNSPSCPLLNCDIKNLFAGVETFFSSFSSWRTKIWCRPWPHQNKKLLDCSSSDSMKKNKSCGCWKSFWMLKKLSSVISSILWAKEASMATGDELWSFSAMTLKVWGSDEQFLRRRISHSLESKQMSSMPILTWEISFISSNSLGNKGIDEGSAEGKKNSNFCFIFLFFTHFLVSLHFHWNKHFWNSFFHFLLPFFTRSKTFYRLIASEAEKHLRNIFLRDKF